MSRKFAIETTSTSAQVLSDSYVISNVVRCRFTTENCDVGNVYTLSAKIKGSNTWSSLGTITGNDNKTFSVFTYDVLKIELTTYATTGNFVKIIGQGFVGSEGGGVQKVADSSERNALNPEDGDIVIQLDNDTLYMYDGNTTSWIALGGAGSVTGPGSSTDNAIVRFDGASGSLLKDSSVILSDVGVLTGVDDVRSGSTSVVYRVEKFTLNGGQIAAKQVTILRAPQTPANTRWT
jgi:hypothetical protein